MNFRLITHVITHFHPHLDEYLAMLIFMRFGTCRAHFASNLVYQEIVCPMFENLEQQNPNWLVLGVGNGRFDDHGPLKEKSCSQLVCEFLGLEDNPRLYQIVKAVTLQDKQGGQSKNTFSFPRIINQMHRQGRLTREEIRAWVMTGLSAILDSEAQKVLEIQTEAEGNERKFDQLFASHARSWFYLHVERIAELIPGEQGKQWLATAKQVQEQQAENFSKATKVARGFVQVCNTRFGERRLLIIDGSEGQHTTYETEFDSASRVGGVQADLVLLRSSAGHTMVSVNRNAGFNLAEFVAILRKEEAAKRGLEIPNSLLLQEGAPKEHSQWYVHERIGYSRVYNGTTTRPVVDTTELSFEEIQDLLYNWLQEKETQAVA